MRGEPTFPARRYEELNYEAASSEPRVHTRLFSEKLVVDSNATPVCSTSTASMFGNTDSAGIIDARPILSVTLIDELATQRRQILVAHIASDTGRALDLTIFLMAQNVVFGQNHIPNPSTLKSGAAGFSIVGFRDEGSMASQTIDDQRQRLDTSWAGHKTMTAGSTPSGRSTTKSGARGWRSRSRVR